jgi:hypothetical protein
MWVWGPDCEGRNTCVQAHVKMLAREWETRASSETTGPKRRHHLNVRPRQHHHFHLPLHPAH